MQGKQRVCKQLCPWSDNVCQGSDSVQEKSSNVPNDVLHPTTQFWYVFTDCPALLLCVFVHVCVAPSADEHTQLRHLHVSVKEEHQGVVLKLRGQLKNAHCELEKVRASLKTLQGADGHG